MSLPSLVRIFAVLSFFFFFFFLVLCLLLCLVLGAWCLGGEKMWESKGIFWVCSFFFLGLLIFSGFLGLLIFFSLFAFLENK